MVLHGTVSNSVPVGLAIYNLPQVYVESIHYLYVTILYTTYTLKNANAVSSNARSRKYILVPCPPHTYPL